MLSQLGEGGHAFAQIASLRWTVIACDQKGLCEYAVSKYSTPWNLEGISELIYPHLLYNQSVGRLIVPPLITTTLFNENAVIMVIRGAGQENQASDIRLSKNIERDDGIHEYF